MPKGRGSTKRHQSDRQRRPKDKTATTGPGYLKLLVLGQRSVDLAASHIKVDPVAKSVQKHRDRSAKRAAKRKKARQKWAA